jgi:hypothetical protein
VGSFHAISPLGERVKRPRHGLCRAHGRRTRFDVGTAHVEDSRGALHAVASLRDAGVSRESVRWTKDRAGRTRFHPGCRDRNAVSDRRHAVGSHPIAGWRHVNSGSCDLKAGSCEVNRECRGVNRGQPGVNRKRGSSEQRLEQREVGRRECDSRLAESQPRSSRLKPGRGARVACGRRVDSWSAEMRAGRERIRVRRRHVRHRLSEGAGRPPGRNLLFLAPLLIICRGRRFATNSIRWATTRDAGLTPASHLAARRGVFARHCNGAVVKRASRQFSYRRHDVVESRSARRLRGTESPRLQCGRPGRGAGSPLRP